MGFSGSKHSPQVNTNAELSISKSPVIIESQSCKEANTGLSQLVTIGY